MQHGKVSFQNCQCQFSENEHANDVSIITSCFLQDATCKRLKLRPMKFTINCSIKHDRVHTEEVLKRIRPRISATESTKSSTQSSSTELFTQSNFIGFINELSSTDLTEMLTGRPECAESLYDLIRTTPPDCGTRTSNKWKHTQSLCHRNEKKGDKESWLFLVC